MCFKNKIFSHAKVNDEDVDLGRRFVYGPNGEADWIFKSSDVTSWAWAVEQGYDIEEKIEATGSSSKFQLFTYDKTHTNIATNNPELAERIRLFLSQL